MSAPGKCVCVAHNTQTNLLILHPDKPPLSRCTTSLDVAGLSFLEANKECHRNVMSYLTCQMVPIEPRKRQNRVGWFFWGGGLDEVTLTSTSAFRKKHGKIGPSLIFRFSNNA